MRRMIAIAFGLALVLGTSSVGLAARPAPSTLPIAISVSTLDVSATCVGTGTPCDSTIRLTFSGTVSGQQPFAEIKGVKDPQTVVGTFDFPMATYDAETECFSGAMGTIQFLVPKGSGARLAFEVDSIGITGCAGTFSAAFTVDSDAAEHRTFDGATGSGVLLLQSDLDHEAVTVSALQVDLSGQVTLTR